jgi:hypothetical protein
MSDDDLRAQTIRPFFRGLTYVLLGLFVVLGVTSFVLAAIQDRFALAALGAVNWIFAGLCWQIICRSNGSEVH